jgi:uncharacterized protein YciW
MKIKLTDKCYLSTDAHNFILSRARKKNGKEVFEAVSFYPTLSKALEGFINQQMRNSSVTTVKELLDKQRKLEAYVNRLTETNVSYPK